MKKTGSLGVFFILGIAAAVLTGILSSGEVPGIVTCLLVGLFFIIFQSSFDVHIHTKHTIFDPRRLITSNSWAVFTYLVMLTGAFKAISFLHLDFPLTVTALFACSLIWVGYFILRKLMNKVERAIEFKQKERAVRARNAEAS